MLLTKLRWLIIATLVLASVSLMAAESSVSIHKQNYFISGNDDVKFQISVKYNVLYPFNLGWYFAYTEVAFWDIYEKSSPFREFNHNPETFFELREGNNIFSNSDLGFIDFIRLSPYEHISNGRDGDYSRGLDRTYGEIQVSVGTKYNVGIRAKGWHYYKMSRYNRDIGQYTGHGEGEVFAAFCSEGNKDIPLYKVYFKGGIGDSGDKGWYEAGAIATILTGYIQPRLFINVYHGYGESLVDYNKKDTQVRVGAAFLY